MEIGLVSCTKAKADGASTPRELYEPSALFRKARSYVEENHDEWYVLSAKYNVLAPDGSPIEPYDETLNNAGVKERRLWSRTVVDQLRERDLLTTGIRSLSMPGRRTTRNSSRRSTTSPSMSRFRPRDFGWVRHCRGTMTVSEFYADNWLGVKWSAWGPLDPSSDNLRTFSTEEGLYRVRHPERAGLEYIGETGRNLRGRVRALAHGAFAEEMPYRDPHTAAPCLWAIQQEYGEKLEVSVAAPMLANDKRSRKAFEDALIAVYRRETGESPTANFGRIIDGYRQSTYRSGGERGGPLNPEDTESNAENGVDPLDWRRSDDVLSRDWMGLSWSTPEPLAEVDTSIPTDAGLYRIWEDGQVPPMEYLGQSSNLKSRLYRHRRNRDEALLFSYSELDNHDALHKREEVETELIGAHWLTVGTSPRDQF